MLGPRRDTEEFPEFYAEYDQTQGFSGAMATASAWDRSLRRAGRLARDIDNLTRRGRRLARHRVPARRRAGQRRLPAQGRALREREAYSTPSPTRSSEYRRSSTPACPAGRRRPPPDDARPMVPRPAPRTGCAGPVLRIDALNRALEGLPEDRTRYHICWGSFNSPHVGDVPFKEIADLVLGVRRRVRHRDGQPPPRARVAGVGGPRSARGQGAHPRRHQPRHERRRAPGAGVRAPGPPREARRSESG